MKDTIEIRTVVGQELLPYIPDLARLRIRVFRDYPYLYDGTEQYEEKYLKTYSSSELALAVLAVDLQSGAIAGVSTGIPMEQETEEFKKPFRERGMDPSRIFYCGESVLLPEYRGQGLYRHFWTEREGYARRLGLDFCCFCAVVRPDDHPLRPKDYQPLDAIWRRFGYSPDATLLTLYPWKDIDQQQETLHTMMFWTKPLQEPQG